jgi:hypothetical protein
MRARYGGAFGTSVAIHAAIAAWLALPIALAPSSKPQERRPMQVVLLPPAEDSAFPGLKPVERSRRLPDGDFKQDGELAGADVDRIANHHLVLFPFVTPGLALDTFFPGRPSSSRLVFENPYVKPPTTAQAGPGRTLEMNAAARQSLVDRAWTRSNRWRAFDPIRQLTEHGNADDPDLASLLALYREQNALQPYADGPVRDLRFWAQLGLAADHVEFIGFIRRYAAAHPSTKVTTELLLLLDTLAQANEDALAVLVETNQPGDLDWTREYHPRAYLLARQIQQAYVREIVRLGLVTRPAVEDFYRRGRIALLTRILVTTPNGYRADDARFLIGEILWNQARRDEALRVWSELTGTEADGAYATAIAQLRVAIAPGKPDARNIRFILSNQDGRWRSFSNDRLRRFGYRADTY